MTFIFEALSLILSNIGRILAVVGAVSIGSWAIRKVEPSSSSSTGTTSGSSSISSPATFLGDAKLWGWAVIVFGGALVLTQLLKDWRPADEE